MVSLCLKSFVKNTIDELEKYISTIEIPNIFYSQKKFKNFYNIIIHYTGKNITNFYEELSNSLSLLIVEKYEQKFVRSQLRYDFFYFSDSELQKIYNRIEKKLTDTVEATEKQHLLHENIYGFIKDFHSFNIDGLINFRIPSYKGYVRNILENEVHNYIVDKEYSEYVTLLRDYLVTQTPKVNILHLIYSDSEKILLDGYGNVVTTTAEKKYLSDISFSSNEFILNSLISLVPSRIVIHSNFNDDNFISFLEKIFEGKCQVCHNCKICNTYQKDSGDYTTIK